jgi:threonine synthase
VKYISDPHGAVSYLGLKAYLDQLKDETTQGIFFETAHPVKFATTVEATLKIKLDPPKQIEKILNKTKLSIPINDYKSLKNFFLDR